MPDMLVHLLKLPPLPAEHDRLASAGVVVRRARPYEIGKVRRFVLAHFAETWADEISVGYANKPTTVWIAVRDRKVVGFAAVECTRRGFFGPTGVDPAERGRGVGRGLLIAGLHGLAELGYAYGVIGGAGPTGFYERAVGAVEIPDSSPGVYGDPID